MTVYNVTFPRVNWGSEQWLEYCGNVLSCNSPGPNEAFLAQGFLLGFVTAGTMAYFIWYGWIRKREGKK